VFDIGASLREAREKRGLALADVQKELRIRERYLNALETERWELLPGEAYVKGFLRTYAEFLGLNSSLYLDEFNERFAAPEAEPFVPESLAPRRAGGGILTRTIVGAFVLAVVVFAATAWRPGASPAPHVAAAKAATPKPALPLGMPVAPAPDPPKAQPKVALIRATKGRSWFSVRVGGPGGREIFRGFLNRGHRLTYRLDRKVWLRIGRPRAVVVTLGGRTVRGLPGVPVDLLLTQAGPVAG
jgi:cytoskeleton protein RodZ